MKAPTTNTTKSATTSATTTTTTSATTRQATSVITLNHKKLNNNQNHNNNNNNNNNNNISKNNINNNKHEANNKQKTLLPKLLAAAATTTATATMKTASSLMRTKNLLTWPICRKWGCKRFIILIVLALIFMLYIFTIEFDNNGVQQRIDVVHYSTVPGMKDAQNSSGGSSGKELLASQVQQRQLSNLFGKPEIKFNTTIDENRTAAAALVHAPVAVAAALAAAATQATADAANAGVLSTNYHLNNNKNNNNNNNNTTTINNNNNSTYSQSNFNQQNSHPSQFNLWPLPPPPSPPPGYLVWSERCKMPNVDPYLPEIMKYFKREKYKPCSVQSPLTTVQFSESSQRYVLRVVHDVLPSYVKKGNLKCCYQIIERNSTGSDADKDVSLSDCIDFENSTKLAPHIDNILVKCRVKKKQIYINGHAMMPERSELRERLEKWRTTDHKAKRQRPPSVLMIGIDSISRTNLIRAMPRTAQYLYDNEWFEMSGYNKIDDNTFPNLVAVLAGYNKTYAYDKCPPTTLNALDNCSFIWRTFREHGYVTAYAEDEASINTFNYLKMGFERPPVDYYLRPFLLSAEKHLRATKVSGLNFCLGYQHSADFVYEYAIELARRYKHEPYFGLFWTNSFSHNAISDCTAMDEKMVEYLKRFSELGAFDESIVIFFSDHGMRFGPTRNSHSGHLEERLPFLFIWLPQSIKQTHPEFVNALSVNKNRLTNPYDMHMTLKHILGMSSRVTDQTQLQTAESCARCQTLLEPVPHNRSCEDINIEAHWCTCIPYQNVYKNSKVVQNLAKAAVSYINRYVAEFKNGTYEPICVPLHLSHVESAYRAQPGSLSSYGINTTTAATTAATAIDANDSIEIYRLIFQTKPNKALFEATLRVASSAKLLPNPPIEVTGEISRLNTYSADSECVPDGGAKKYCSCRKKKLF